LVAAFGSLVAAITAIVAVTKMQSVGWQGAKSGAEIPLDTLTLPRASSGPDFARLIEVLMSLRQYLDPESGETVLTTEEAAGIRACGFVARAGRWRCPLLPDDLVWHLPVLSALSDAIGPELRGSRWHPKRAAIRPMIPPTDPLSKFERRLIRRLQDAPGQRLDRGALKRTYWRRGAAFVDFTIDSLIAGDYITEHGHFLPAQPGRTEGAAGSADARACTKLLVDARPLRPVPVSTIY
jgi:hypothetical protein